MIRYKDSFFDMLKMNGINSYVLQNKYKMPSGSTTSVFHKKSISFSTLDKLCEILECDISDILEYIPNKYAIKEEGDTD